MNGKLNMSARRQATKKIVTSMAEHLSRIPVVLRGGGSSHRCRALIHESVGKLTRMSVATVN
jgi:hypothetical protein